MRGRSHRGMRLVSVLTILFLGVHLLGPLRGIGPKPVFAATDPPPLPVPNDPLAAQPEGAQPEISIDVDARDGHLTVRVIDSWGPGKTPFLVSTYNSNNPPTETSGVGVWHINQILEINQSSASALYLREPDGTVSTYPFSGTTIGSDGLTYYIFTKNIGMVAAIWTQVTYRRQGTGGDIDEFWDWSGVYTQYLPKGATRRFVGPMKTQVNSNPFPALWAGIVENRDANNNVTAYNWAQPAGVIRAYLQTVTDPIGRVTTYSYVNTSCEMPGGDPPCLWHQRINTITDPWGRVVTPSPVGGPLTSITNWRGFTYSFLWEVPDGVHYRVTRVTAPGGAVTNYTYLSNATVVWNARGYGTNHYYNSSGDITSVVDPLGGVTSFAYDGLHNVTQVTNPRGIRTTYAYNAHNKVTQVIQNADGLNLTTTLTWDSNDNLLSVTNPRGITTAYGYNAQHNLTSMTKAQGTPAQAVMQYTYNSWGGVATMVDPRLKTTGFTYDARRRLTTVTPPVGGTTTYGYNTLDDRTSMTNGNGRTSTYTYDTKRNLLTETDPLGYPTSYQYDAVGNRTRVTDAKGFATVFVYDSRDRLTTITDPLQGSTSYLYDAVSNLERITNARGHPTNFVYDANNRLTSVTDALNRTTSYQYDAAGNRTRMTDRKGQVFTYTYDALDRLTQVQVGSTTFSYAYDPGGNRLTLVDGTGTTAFQYDELDRLTRMTYPDTKAVIYTYDAAGNRRTLRNPANVLFTYDYDDANRLSRIIQGSRIWNFGYDGAGNRTSLAHPNGASIAYTYLNNNWLGTIAHKRSGGVTFDTIVYGYDQNGNRTTVTESTGTTTYGYNQLNRLTSAAYPGGYGTWSWTYDSVGNRITQNSPSGQTNYSYDGNNRLTSATGKTYSYDNNGNLIGISTGESFTYDPHNRLTLSDMPQGLDAQYTYNGDGLKIRRIAGAQTTRYYHDGIRLIYEAKADGSRNADLERDIFGNLLARQDDAGSRFYYHHDGLGSTVALTNASGIVAGQRTYDAWGKQRTTSGSPPGSYQFAGAELDAASGLYHMGARFYDPALGRWLSEDPVQDKPFEPATLNFYAYVRNNPGLMVDISGRDPSCNAAIPLFDAGECGPSGGSGGGSVRPARDPRGPAATAASIAGAAIEAAKANANKLSHIFGQPKHGFEILGISREAAFAGMTKAITDGVQSLGGVGGLAVGKVYEWSSIMGAGMRVVVTGIWNGTQFKIGTAFMQVLVNGEWVKVPMPP